MDLLKMAIICDFSNNSFSGMCYHTLEETSSFGEMRRKWAMVSEASMCREILRNFTRKGAEKCDCG